jgi:hypothetical protein
MRRFIREQSGSALLWPFFIILILITLSFTVYSGITVYAKYQACENELQQAAIISADENMKNAYVRDLLLDIPPDSAELAFKDNLAKSGWTMGDESWIKHEGEKTIYSLEDTQIEIEGRRIQINAMFVMPLPWVIGDITSVSIPMQVRASILYLDLGRS